MSSPGKPTHYRLAPAALDELDGIWRYTAETWSLEQADRYVDDPTGSFQTLVAMPGLARERSEFQPPIRIHLHASHLVIYTVEDDHIAILRVLGGRQDWRTIFKALD